MRRISPHALGLILLTIIFVTINLFANVSFRAARLDLTQNNLFTLSDGTRNILGLYAIRRQDLIESK